MQRDDLTGLYLYSSLQTEAEELRTRGEFSGAVVFMFVDVDNLKRINDSLGHGIGDEVIKFIANTLQKTLPRNSLTCRKGGDEFLAVVPVENEEHGISLAMKIQSGIRKSSVLCDHVVEITCSIGLSVSFAAEFDFRLEERRADVAMYFSKNNGKNKIKVYCSEDCKQVELVHDLSIEFPRALRLEALSCAFQPIYAMRERRVVGCESLIRWNHSRFGKVPAEKIVEIAKRAGGMKELSHAVLRMACKNAAAWPEEVYVSVNFVASDFLHKDFGEVTLNTLSDFGIYPGRLYVEITETELLELNETVLKNIDSMRKAGVRIGIDDFGTGYSSMSTIDLFPADFLKIDRSLVHACSDRESSKIFLRAIRQVAEKQSLEVIAEGVETISEAATLQACGINFAQGYYYQKPASKPNFSSCSKSDNYCLRPV